MQRMGQGSNKTRTKLEKLLRQDHSDVYFENDKLNDKLSCRIQGMQKDLLYTEIQRGQEIANLRREIITLRTFTSNTEQQLQNIRHRPHTAGCRKRTVSPERPRAKSAWGQTDAEAVISQKALQEPEVNDAAPTELETRCNTPISSVSTLKNIKTLRKYQNVEGYHFKENNRFPEEWYVKCIPASDAAIYNSKRKVRGKSAPPYFDFLARLREKDTIDKKLSSFTKSSKLTANRNNKDMNEGTEREGLSLICEQPVKPILMSLRRLKELSNGDTAIDRGPSRNTQRQQNMLQLGSLERHKLDVKVKQFCESLEEMKSREARAVKEREEELKKEAQEQLYMKNINLEEMEKPEVAEKDDDSDDDRYFNNKWK